MQVEDHALPPAAVMVQSLQELKIAKSLSVVKSLVDIPRGLALQMLPMAPEDEVNQTSIDETEEPGGYTLEHWSSRVDSTAALGPSRTGVVQTGQM